MTRICHMEKNFQPFFTPFFVSLRWNGIKVKFVRCRVYDACIAYIYIYCEPKMNTKITPYCAKCIAFTAKTNGFCCCHFIYVWLFSLAVRRCCNACGCHDDSFDVATHGCCIAIGICGKHQMETHIVQRRSSNGIRHFFLLLLLHFHALSHYSLFVSNGKSASTLTCIEWEKRNTYS